MSDIPDTTSTPAPEEHVPAETTTKEMAPAHRRRDPFSMLGDLDVMMDRMLGRRWPLLRSVPRFGDVLGDWDPQVDMYEQGDQLVVKAELPGVAREDIDVEIENGDLVIKGERHSEHEVKEEHAYRMERSFGSFYRRLPLPEGVKEEDISATYTDGVLEVRTPKAQAEKPAPKKIAIT
jgi:HSP20 family protein